VHATPEIIQGLNVKRVINMTKTLESCPHFVYEPSKMNGISYLKVSSFNLSFDFESDSLKLVPHRIDPSSGYGAIFFIDGAVHQGGHRSGRREDPCDPLRERAFAFIPLSDHRGGLPYGREPMDPRAGRRAHQIYPPLGPLPILR